MMKKIINSVFSVALAGLMVVPALAADAVNITITDKGADSGDVYDAYQLMGLEVKLNGDDTCTGEHTSACYSYNYSVNETYRACLLQGDLNEESTDADILDYIGAMATDSDELQEYADAVYRAIMEAGLDPTVSTEGTSFEGVDQGYYLLVEKSTATGGSYAKSLVMLDTAGQESIEVISKAGGVPTVNKEVLEKNDMELEDFGYGDENNSSTSSEENWGTTADYDAGDIVQFRLTGTMPDNIDEYARYKYVFMDTLDSTLTFQQILSITVDGKEVDEDMYTVTDSTNSLLIKFVNIKNITAEGSPVELTKDSKVVVTYTAKLADSSEVLTQQDNKVQLEYSTDPYFTGSGTSGYEEPTTTPEPGTDSEPGTYDPQEPTDYTTEVNVRVFTYTLIVNKVDQSNTPVNGATFTLYKYNANDASEDAPWVKVNTIIGEDSAEFTFKGLDAGQYKLVETTPPAGYTKAEDIIFNINATTTLAASGSGTITELSVTKEDGSEFLDEDGNPVFKMATDTDDTLTGEITASVENVGGSLLPSTGGTGTYMLYGLGCALLVGGATLAVTKKRKRA